MRLLTSRILSRQALSTRHLPPPLRTQLIPRRFNSSDQQSPPPSSSSTTSAAPQQQQQRKTEPNPHREFYSTLGPAIFKVFLGALVTYQALYYGWLSLEEREMRAEKDGEAEKLESELRRLVESKRSGNDEKR